MHREGDSVSGGFSSGITWSGAPFLHAEVLSNTACFDGQLEALQCSPSQSWSLTSPMPPSSSIWEGSPDYQHWVKLESPCLMNNRSVSRVPPTHEPYRGVPHPVPTSSPFHSLPLEFQCALWYNASRGELFHSELTGRWGCWDGVWLLMHGHHPRQLPALPASSHWTFAFLLLPLVSSFHQPNATTSIPESQQRFGLPPGKWLSVGWGDSGGPPSQRLVTISMLLNTV